MGRRIRRVLERRNRVTNKPNEKIGRKAPSGFYWFLKRFNFGKFLKRLIG